MLPSPNGRYVTIAGWDDDSAASVAIIDVATGEHVVATDLRKQLADWNGEPFPTRWLSDDELLIGGLCHCDGSPEGYFDAIVRLDGSVERAPSDLPPPKPVKIEARDGSFPSCALSGFAGSRSVHIVDAVSGDVLAQATDEAPVLIGGELSPDNTEALISALDADAGLRGRLIAALERGDCYVGPETNYGEANIFVSLLRVGATSLEPVETHLEVFERWYGASLPVFTCGGEKRAGVITTGWFDHAAWRDPAGYGQPWGFASASCGGRGASIEMTIAAVSVDSDAEGYRVLALLDSTPSAED